MSRLACVIGMGVSLAAGSAIGQVSNSYVYDAQGRLITSTRTISGVSHTTSYSIDDADNRTERSTTSAAGRAGAPQAANASTGNDLPAVEQPAPNETGEPSDGDLPLNDNT